MNSSMTQVRMTTVQPPRKTRRGRALTILVPCSPARRSAQGSRKSGCGRRFSIARKTATMNAVSETSWMGDSAMMIRDYEQGLPSGRRTDRAEESSARRSMTIWEDMDERGESRDGRMRLTPFYATNEDPKFGRRVFIDLRCRAGG